MNCAMKSFRMQSYKVLKNIKEYHEINNSINKVLMKEAYFRGVKDMILMLARANIFKESQ